MYTKSFSAKHKDTYNDFIPLYKLNSITTHYYYAMQIYITDFI